MMRRTIAGLIAVLIAGCSGAGAPFDSSRTLPLANADANAAGRATLSVVLRIPRHDRRQEVRGSRYLSPSTKSIVASLQPGKGTPVKAFANTTPSSPSCTAGPLLALTCTVTIRGLKPGPYTASISTYDAKQTSANGTPNGHLLSANTVSTTVRTGKANAIKATLDAVPASVTVSAAANQSNVAGNDSSGLFTLGGSTATVLVAADDVDGNVIVGLGSPVLSLVVQSASGGINAAPVANNPNAFALSSTGLGSASLLATATPAKGSVVSVNVAVTAVTTTTLLAGQVGSTGSNDGTGTGAQFNTATGMAYDTGDGNLYVADYFNCTIRKVTTGGVVTTVAGTAGTCDGANSDLDRPAAVVYDPDDQYLYVADYNNCTIDRVPLTSGTFSRIAGTAGTCNGTGSDLNGPSGITYAGSATLYVSDTNNCVVRKIANIDTAPAVTTFAGTVAACNATGSDLRNPAGIAYDGSGALYVADEHNCEIRKIVISGPTVSTLAGSSTNCTSVDGTGAAAGFAAVYGVAYDQAHALLYVTDASSGEIRTVTTSSGAVTTISGTGREGYAEGSLVQAALMSGPQGVVYVPGSAGALGTVYFTDTNNDIVRQLNL